MDSHNIYIKGPEVTNTHCTCC